MEKILSEKWKPLIVYENYWFRRLISRYVHDCGSLFPPSLWALTDINDRTNNACESLYASYNKLFSSSQPNIFVTVKYLNYIQTKQYINIRSIDVPNIS